jgi:hypothetical protein
VPSCSISRNSFLIPYKFFRPADIIHWHNNAILWHCRPTFVAGPGLAHGAEGIGDIDDTHGFSNSLKKQ